MGLAILAKLTSPPALRRSVRNFKYRWRKTFFWILYVQRKSRFALLGVDRSAPLAVAHLGVAASCTCAPSRYLLRHTNENLRELARHTQDPPLARPLAATAAVIDLDEFPDFQSWRVQVSRATSGKYHRSANKARRMGYATRLVGHDSYRRSVYELTGSKLRRSKGMLVWAAILGPGSGLEDSKAPPVPPLCPQHWRQCWAAFRQTGEGEQLAASAIFIRAGNVIWVQRFIGHGEALKDGVTKMLIFDIMETLLARADPATQGIRYLVHGSVEEGGDGLFDWKRYLGFKPMLIGQKDVP